MEKNRFVYEDEDDMAGITTSMDKRDFEFPLKSLRYEQAVNKLKGSINNNPQILHNFEKRDPGKIYIGKRGAMMVDVVLSRQRRYASRVRPMILTWSTIYPNNSLEDLAINGLSGTDLKVRPGEQETLIMVAQNFLKYGSQNKLKSDEEIISKWIKDTENFKLTPELDPVVGSVKGIGLALYNYARLLSGANTLKPDVRTRKQIAIFGFGLISSDYALYKMCELIALELNIELKKLDYFLWSLQDLSSD